MSPRNAKILSVSIFLVMMVPIFATQMPSNQKIKIIDIEDGMVEEPEQNPKTTLQDRGTRQDGGGTVLEEVSYQDMLAYPGYEYITWGWEFQMNYTCTVSHLGAYWSFYPYEYLNVRIWTTGGSSLLQSGPIPAGNDTWVWVDTVDLTLSAGSKYIISAYIHTDEGDIPAVENPGTTPEGMITPLRTLYRPGYGHPIYEYNSTLLPMIDFRYYYYFPPKPPYITVPDDYGTIQEAIDAANVGDSIFVKENTVPYNEELTMNKTISLIGEDMTSTIIDATGVTGGNGIVALITADDVIIRNFTITGGDYGIYCDHADRVYIRDNIISENKDYGIYLDTVNNCRIRWNTISDNNFDLDADGFGMYALNSHVENLWYNTISFNEVGLKLINTKLGNCVNWNTFIGNGIAVDYDPEPLEIDGNVFIDNTIAIKISGDDSLLTITDNIISGSEIGIYVETGSPVIESNIFTDNEYAIYYLGGSNPVIINNTFINNSYDIYSIALATLDIDPDTLNLKSRGKWITVYIILPETCNASDINFETISMGDGTFELGGEYGEFDNNVCTAKFDRSDLEDLIGVPNEALELTLTGELMDGTPLIGSDTIRVILPGH